MANWLFIDKSGSYGSLKPQKGKDGKPNDSWNIHISFDEMMWKDDGGMFTILTHATSCTGHSVMKDQQDKVKFPMPIKIQFPIEGATVGERCIMAVLKQGTSPDKVYSGFLAMNDDNPFALAIADGKKADGTPMSEADIKAMSGQFLGVMESTASKLTGDLIQEMSTAKSYSKGGGYSKAETLAEQIATREAWLKKNLGLDASATLSDVVAAYKVTVISNPEAVELIKTILA